MRKNTGNEIQESEKVFALTMVLVNTLILSVVLSIVWLVQIIISQFNQLNELSRGFYPI